MKNKPQEIKDTKVISLYEGLTLLELSELIKEVENKFNANSDVTDKDSIDDKKIKKGTFEKNFFRGKK